MTIIGHASIDENKKTKGGNAGDQTGREVYIRNYYNNNWTYVLRCKNTVKAELMAVACEKGCKNDFIGYDQNQRNTLRTEAQKVGFDLSQIKTPCECDCSSFMTVCAESAGILVPYSGSNAPTTTTMLSAFNKTGMFEILTDSKYLTSDKYLKRGDILVKKGSHTIMILSDGANATTKNNSLGFEVGKNYTLTANLYIREQPFGEKMKFSCITSDAQKHSSFDEYGCAILNKGTTVTCKAVKTETDSIWLLIPSGWICAKKSAKIYVK